MEKFLEKFLENAFIIITLLSIFSFMFGVASIDSPNTAIPEIMTILPLAYWCLLLWYRNHLNKENVNSNNK